MSLGLLSSLDRSVDGKDRLLDRHRSSSPAAEVDGGAALLAVGLDQRSTAAGSPEHQNVAALVAAGLGRVNAEGGHQQGGEDKEGDELAVHFRLLSEVCWVWLLGKL